MSGSPEICARRIVSLNLEGYRANAYDDETGKEIVSEGVVTVGYGCACRGWSRDFSTKVLILQLADFEAPLLKLDWYIGCDEVRRSALLEIAYNQGDSGLENGYPKLIACLRRSDWFGARMECSVADARLKHRYEIIGQVLYSGVSA